MEYGAIDLHKKESQIRIVTERGEVLGRRTATTRDRFTAVFEGRRPMRILLEASIESEWVAQHLETLGHEVIVADPTFAPMYTGRDGVYRKHLPLYISSSALFGRVSSVSSRPR